MRAAIATSICALPRSIMAVSCWLDAPRVLERTTVSLSGFEGVDADVRHAFQHFARNPADRRPGGPCRVPSGRTHPEPAARLPAVLRALRNPRTPGKPGILLSCESAVSLITSGRPPDRSRIVISFCAARTSVMMPVFVRNVPKTTSVAVTVAPLALFSPGPAVGHPGGFRRRCSAWRWQISPSPARIAGTWCHRRRSPSPGSRSQTTAAGA